MIPNDAGEVDAEDRRLCFDCIGEAFLRAEVQKSGRDAVCFYCRGEGQTFSIGEMANRIKFALDQHFYRTSTEPSSIEYIMSKESDYDWEREGDSIANVIERYAEVEPNIAEDIRIVLDDRESSVEMERMGEEEPFE